MVTKPPHCPDYGNPSAIRFMCRHCSTKNDCIREYEYRVEQAEEYEKMNGLFDREGS